MFQMQFEERSEAIDTFVPKESELEKKIYTRRIRLESSKLESVMLTFIYLSLLHVSNCNVRMPPTCLPIDRVKLAIDSSLQLYYRVVLQIRSPQILYLDASSCVAAIKHAPARSRTRNYAARTNKIRRV